MSKSNKYTAKRIVEAVSTISATTVATTTTLNKEHEQVVENILNNLSPGGYERLNDVVIEMLLGDTDNTYWNIDGIQIVRPTVLIKNHKIISDLKSDKVEFRIAVDRWRRKEWRGIRFDTHRKAGWKHDINPDSLANRPAQFLIENFEFLFYFHQEKYFHTNGFPKMKGCRSIEWRDEGNRTAYQGQLFALRIVVVDKETGKQLYSSKHLYKFKMFGLWSQENGNQKVISYKPI